MKASYRRAVALCSHPIGRRVDSPERQRGIGLRGGPGESQLEVDRRLLNQRIHRIEKKLAKTVTKTQ